MKDYTKEQRNEIYKQALLWLRRAYQQELGMYYLCWGLSSAVYGTLQEGCIDLNDFPEILRQKPEQAITRIAWFWMDEFDAREKILETAIKETE